MDQIVNQEVAAFANEFEQFKDENQGIIADLVSAIEDQINAVDTVLDEHAAVLKSALGADASDAASDDQDAQLSAIAEAEKWITNNINHGELADRIAAVLWMKGCDTGEALLRERLPLPESVKVRLTIDVSYLLNGELAADMASRLQAMCLRAIGDGMLTGHTAAEVDEYSMTTAIMPKPLTEDELASFMQKRIDNGEWEPEDIPVRLARFGLMEPPAFVAEMRERMCAS